jgi:hypothetical protein
MKSCSRHAHVFVAAFTFAVSLPTSALAPLLEHPEPIVDMQSISLTRSKSPYPTTYLEWPS